MPAIANEPPDGISTTVSAFRVRMDGMVTLLPNPCDKVRAFSGDRSDTSVATLRLMRPSDKTTGVKVNPTPNFLYDTCVWHCGGTFVVSQVKFCGIGNSPPAIKVAVSPEIAVKFGSAKVLTTPARSMARNVAFTLCNDPVRKLFESAWPLAAKGLSVLKLTTAEPYPTLPDRATPSCFTTSRCTSATVTFSMTWSRPRTVIPLTTFLSSPTSLEAMSYACCASTG